MHSAERSTEELLAHVGWVRRVAAALARNADEADELEQETWSAALAHLHAAPEDLRAWLAGVVRRVAALRRRSERRRSERELAAARAEALEDTHELVARARLQRELVDAVLELDQPYRDTLLLRYFDECSPSEIAERQRVPLATVKSRLQRGLAKLRAQLDQRHAGREGWLGAAVALALFRRPLEGVWLVKSKLALVAALVLAAVVLTWSWESQRELSTTSSATAADRLQRSSLAAHATPAPDDAAAPSEGERTSTQARAEVQAESPFATSLLRGRVVSLASKALSGVEVEVRHSRGHGRPGWDGFDEPEPDVVARLRSDANGAFEFELGRRACVDLWIAPSQGWSGALSQARRGGEFVELQLTPAGSLTGEVTLITTGAPVADATVELVARDQLPGAPRPHTTRTDALGRYRIEGVSAGPYWLHVTPRDARPERFDELEFNDAEHRLHDVVVEPGVVVRGRVLDAVTRRPVANARISDDHVQRIPALHSGADGRFELRGMDDGTFGHNSLLVQASGYAPRTHHWTGSSLGDREVEIELAPGRRVSGRVLHADGAPREGAFVAALALTAEGSANERERRSTRSASDGRFELRDLRSDVHYTLLVQDTGAGELVLELPASDEREQDLGELRLPEECALRGVVVDERGAPVPFELLELHGPRGTGAASPMGLNALLAAQRQTRSDSLGRFAFEQLGPGVYALSTNTRGAASRARREFELAAGQSLNDVRFELPQRRELFGRVVDARGAPVARAFVALYPNDGGPERLAWQIANNDGSFRFLALPARGCDLFAAGARESGASTWLHALEADGPALLVALGPARRVRGVVRSAGVARPGLTVEAFARVDRRAATDRASTDREGRFELSLASEEHELVVRRGESVLLLHKLAAGDALELELEAP